MQSGQSTVKNIFDGTRIFNIPIYQRSYAWGDENLEALLSDLINQNEERQYFLGTFLFHINGKEGDFALIDIVDGQQRLTSFIILMKVLIDKLSKCNSTLVSNRTVRTYIKDDDIFKLTLSNGDASFLHNYILSSQNISEDTIKFPSQRLLKNAKDFFTKKCEELDLNILEKIFKKATEAEVLLYVVEKITAATQIFELLNDRGKKLTPLESIKSFLMYNIGLVSNNPNQLITNIQESFGEIYRLSEAYAINETELLRFHTIAFEKTEEDPKRFIKEKINGLIQKKITKDTIKDEIINYTIRLKESFELYVKLRQNKENLIELNNFYMIGRVNPYYPVLMYVLKEQPKSLQELLISLNKMNLRVIATGLKAEMPIKIYGAIRRNESISWFINNMIINNWWDIENRTKSVISYSNYYEWLPKNLVRYILFSYENSLRKEKGYPLLTIQQYFTGEEREKLSVEHITAKRSKDLVMDESFKKDYLHSIGNLVIDFVASNSRKSNNNTEDKLAEFNLAPIMSQNQIDEQPCDWHDIEQIKNFIQQRDNKLKDFIKKMFSI